MKLVGDTSDALFGFLRDIIYNPNSAGLDIESLDEEYKDLGRGLTFLKQSVIEYRAFAFALSKGDLDINNIPRGNEFIAPLKALHASLRHLTWQTQQVAKGDYKQHVDFMGDFSDAFNEMTAQLAMHRKALEDEATLVREQAKALEQSNRMLTSITYNIPQIIIVVEDGSNDVLYLNHSASEAVRLDAHFVDRIIDYAEKNHSKDHLPVNDDYEYKFGDYDVFYALSIYRIVWNTVGAFAFVMNDISDDRKQRLELEQAAYQDVLTKLYNRLYGMKALDAWLSEKRHFTLCFADLDNLKYVNDNFGHSEGDHYIISAARLMRDFSDEAIVCRLGGDEFFILASGMSLAQSERRMLEICDDLSQKLVDDKKEYYSNISYGIVEVFPHDNYAKNEVLSMADEKMYENKRMNKRIRVTQAGGRREQGS